MNLLRSSAALCGVLVLVGAGACNAPDDVTALVESARSGKSAKVRQGSCQALQSMPGEAASDALIGFLDHPEHCWCAAHGLGVRKEVRAVQPLIERLTLGDACTSQRVWALGEIGDKRALAALEELAARVDRSTFDGQRVSTEIDGALAKLQ